MNQGVCPNCSEAIDVFRFPDGSLYCLSCEHRKHVAQVKEAAIRTTREAAWWRKPFVWLAWRLLRPVAWIVDCVERRG